ncbi:hypothetical protein [Pectobacterium aroidearum]|uniref:hypothetical protein n=1 Tax=Pectobacterium aroidearum TaxID=1201031 RepID=UPI001CD706A5|nr:hypothetical protein [Pectobacterium aroidearum]
MAKKSNKSVPREVIQGEIQKTLGMPPGTDLEKKIFDFPSIKKDGSRENVIEKKPYVVLKYFQQGWECFSAWDKSELKLFSDFIQKLSNTTWNNIYSTGGKGNKTGFGYTKYNISDMKSGEDTLKNIQRLISNDLTFFELRINKKLRVHGFQSQSAFFLVMLDRDHRVFPD